MLPRDQELLKSWPFIEPTGKLDQREGKEYLIATDICNLADIGSQLQIQEYCNKIPFNSKDLHVS